VLSRLAAEGWSAEQLGEEAGAALSIGEPWPERGRWLLLAVPAIDLAANAEERVAAMVAAASDEAPSHWALPRVWQPPDDDQPATLALPAPGPWRVDALLPGPGTLAPPELLCRLLLAELLDGLAAAHRRGFRHGLLTPGSLWLAGAPPERLVADCPRDPRVVIVGCGVLAMLAPRARAAAIARAPRDRVAPELRRGDEPGPAADVWAAGAVVRALLPAGGGAEMQPLLDAMQAARADARPTAEAAAVTARDLALAGFAAWQRGAPPPPRLVPSPAPLLPAPGSRPHASPAIETVALRSAAASGAAGGSPRWTLQPPSSRGSLHTGVGLLPPMPFVGRPPAAAPAHGLWLSMAPTAMAGILSVLLAMALLFAAQ
jgi:hypothetical protein